jgi:hypothetical protein
MSDVKNVNPNLITQGAGGAQSFRLAGFPKEFEKGFWDLFDKRYYTILLITWLVLYAFTFFMSTRDWEISESDRAKMKQTYLENLYTQIIDIDETGAGEGEGEGYASVDQKAGEGGEEGELTEQSQRLVGESSSDRVRRQRAGVDARRARRGQMEQEAAGYGVLAALTAGGGSGSGSLAYADILGEAGGAGSGLANAGDLVAGTAALQAATGRGQRTRIAKGGGFGGDGTVGEGGIDELISGTGVSGGAAVARRGSIQLAKGTEVSGAGSGASQRDPDVIDAIINQNKASVEYCYQSQLKLNPDMRGEIMLSFDILPTGKVGGVKIQNTSLNNSKVEQCIIRSIRRWSFPQLASNQGIVTIRTKFIFG